MTQTIEKESGFLVKGSLLAVASIIGRLIGLIYRIPLTNIIGDEGIGYYGSAYEVYSILLIVSSYSIPIAISKIISEKRQKKNFYEINKILNVAIVISIISGIIFFGILFFGAEYIAFHILKTPYSYWSLKIFAPLLIVVSILGVLKGYFQGMGIMGPSALSEIIEQLSNAIVSVWAAYVLVQEGTKIGHILGNPEKYAASYGAAGGTLGTNIGYIIGLLFMSFVFICYKSAYQKNITKSHGSVSTLNCSKTIFTAVVPILFAAVAYNICSIVDQIIFKNISLLQGQAEYIDTWWGVYCGKYKALTNIPIAIATAITAAGVPYITKAVANHRIKDVKEKMQSSIYFIMAVSIPFTVFLSLYAKPMLSLFFYKTNSSIELATQLLLFGSIIVVFYSLATLTNGFLQSVNMMRVPVKNALIALAVQILSLILLMLFFRLHIYAVMIANIIFAFLVFVLNMRKLNQCMKLNISIKKAVIVPVVSSVIMGIISFTVFKLLIQSTGILALAFIISFIVSFVVYFLLMILLKGISQKELLLLPFGKNTIRILKKIKLL